MARKMSFSRALTCAGLLGASLLVPDAVRAAVISPSPAAVTAGSTVEITLSDTFAVNSGIGGIDLFVDFDPDALVLQNVIEGSLLTTAGWDAPVFNPATGKISIAEDLGNDLSGTGDVLELVLGAIATDQTTITTVTLATSPCCIGISGEYQVSASDNIDITAASTVPVSVPEPATAALLLLPTLALVFARGRTV